MAWKRRTLRESLPPWPARFGIRSASSQVLYQLYTNLDYPIVGYYFGAWANGIYAGAYFLVLEPVKTIANVVIDVAFPTFARVRNDRPALIDQFIKFTRLNLIAVLPFVVLIALVLPEFLRVFYVGDKWATLWYHRDGNAIEVTVREGTSPTSASPRLGSGLDFIL